MKKRGVASDGRATHLDDFEIADERVKLAKDVRCASAVCAFALVALYAGFIPAHCASRIDAVRHVPDTVFREGTENPLECLKEVPQRSALVDRLVSALLPGHCVVGMVGQKPATIASAAVKPLTLKQLWTIDTTYRDVQHEVNFRYPSSWRPATQFGYHPPALSNSDIAKPIAGFGYDEDGVGASRARMASPYSPTSLEGFGIVYAAVAAESAANCEAKASEISGNSEHGTVVLGGRSFSIHKTFSGGMTQFMDGKLYTTFVVSTCYLFETSIAGSFLGPADGVQPVAPAQLAFIQSHLLEIMKSVRIVPGIKLRGEAR